MARAKGRKRIASRRSRSKYPRRFKLFKPEWIDPFPWIAGTKPEKMIFAALRLRRIYFIFQDSLPEWNAGYFTTLQLPYYIPDFVLPQYKVIIDPFSDYYHLLPDAVARDAYKMAVYEALGYNFIHPWASEIESKGGVAILNDIPELAAPPKYPMPTREVPYQAVGYRLGPYVGIGSTSVGAANRKRARPRALELRIRSR